MIRVKIKKDRKNHIVGYEVHGHAMYAESGNDIVCSAVSALTQSAIIGLTEVVGIDIDYSTRDGFLQCSVSPLGDDEREKADILLNTMCLALKNIKDGYPSNLSVIEEEV